MNTQQQSKRRRLDINYIYNSIVNQPKKDDAVYSCTEEWSRFATQKILKNAENHSEVEESLANIEHFNNLIEQDFFYRICTTYSFKWLGPISWQHSKTGGFQQLAVHNSYRRDFADTLEEVPNRINLSEECNRT